MIELCPAPAFRQEARSYGPVGLFISEVSGLELELDKFIIVFARKEKRLAKAISKEYPKSAMNKVMFLVRVLIGYPRFRMIPMFADGYWSLSYLFYASEQVFDVRNHLAHGAIDTIEDEGGSLSWIASKANTRKVKNEAGTYVGVVRYRFSEALLEELFSAAGALRRYCRNLRKYWIDGVGWEEHYQDEKRMKYNIRCLQEMGWRPPDVPERGSLTFRFCSEGGATVGEAT